MNMRQRFVFSLVLLGLLLLVTSASAVGIVIPNTQVNSIGSSTTVDLVLDEAPNGFVGYNMTVSLSSPSVAEITAVSYPAWAGTNIDNSTFPADSVWIKAVDLGAGANGAIAPGATNVLLATLTIRGDAAGATPVTLAITKMNDDVGDNIIPAITNGTFTVNVPPVVPVANFSAAPVSGNAPLTVHFTDASTGTGLSWKWDFDNDGDIDSTAENPQYTYAVAGTYSVNLTVNNSAGSDNLLKQGYISVAAANTTVFFNPASKVVASGDTTSMTLYGSIFPAGLAGFNITVSLANPEAGAITGVTFPAWATLHYNSSTLPADSFWFSGVDASKLIGPGATDVALGTINIRGDDPGTTELIVEVIEMDADGGGIITPTVVNGNLVVEGTLTADFSADPTSGQAPLLVHFTDLSIGNGISAWAWDFTNDGTVDSTAQNPQFTYANAGMYTVSLTVSNATASDTEIKTGFVTVTEVPVLPVANFMASPRSGVAPLVVQFNDTSTGTGISAWAWDFDLDGTIDSTEKNPQFTYDSPGSYSVNHTVTNNAGSNSRVKTEFIIVTDEPEVPVADFTASPATGQAPLTVNFTDASSGTPTSWAWDFDNDGTVDSTEENPQFIYSSPGTYSVSLTVSNSAGSDDRLKSDYITVTEVPEVPVADFTGTPMSGQVPLTVQFTDASSGSPTSWAWDFNNDGTVDSTAQNPAAVFADVGTYSVSLTVSNSAGSDTELKADYITATEATEAPVADFTGTPTTGQAPLTVQFTDASSGNPTSWAWDFNNDGTVDSTEENPAYTYNDVGTYSVSLTVTNSEGSDDRVKTDYITVTDEAEVPVADFTADPTSGEAPLTVQFTDASSGTPTSWAWDFNNDGTVDSTEEDPEYTYNDVGTYSVSLTVSNSEGSDDRVKTDYITVTDGTGVPVADFTANPTTGQAPLTVNFTDTSTGNPTSWAWDFDHDGVGDSTEQNPQFTYNTAGSYTVSLMAANSEGSDTKMKMNYITVSEAPPEPPVANFTASLTSGQAPLTVQFTDASTGNLTSWAWDFNNDGTVDSTAENPSHIYTTAGSYSVSLTVTNDAGSDDLLKTDYITVTEEPPEAPVAAFTANPTTGQAPLTVQFTDASTGNPTSWAWDFNNDGTVDSTAENPQFIYASAGSYSVSLTVTNAGGSDEELKTNYIVVTEEPPEAPVADFTASPTSGQAPLTVQFTDASSGNPTLWAWDFTNDGVVDSTDQNPSHTYATAGSYSVSLTVTNTAGSSTEVKSSYITVNGQPPIPGVPVADFVGTPVSGAAPLSVQFTDLSTGNPTQWNWDFNNDGFIDSMDRNPLVSFRDPGDYTVRLWVYNSFGGDGETKTVYIHVTGETPAFPADLDFLGIAKFVRQYIPL